EASRAKLRLNKVKNIKTAYRISVDSRQNNFILFHCPLDGEPSKLLWSFLFLFLLIPLDLFVRNGYDKSNQ
ncbi:hypothetical protein, partial [Enterococcus casseliflavus]|uniref:hypothetical protein n=1 Tax=Enterococcus casseliflavus TaxID=37734 RepID=UPI001E356C21